MKAETPKTKREIDIRFESKNNIILEQETGVRRDRAMSQAAVTRELMLMSERITEEMLQTVKRYELQQGMGDSWELPMSQAAVTMALEELRNGLGSIDVMHSELVRMRDEGTLIPGRRYRIVDYETLCDQQGDFLGTGSGITTLSAGNRFDIIVTAESSTSLSEKAQAVRHEGDTYFVKSRLSAWEIEYCLDNDTKRFKWAVRDGKGVIYRMRDEFGNECPYDFKNIMFKFAMQYPNSNVKSGLAYYTYSHFDGSNVHDYSLTGTYCHNNVMKDCRDYNGKNVLGANVFVNTNSFAYCYENEVGFDCYNNTFGSSCCRNSFGYGCYYNHFPNYYQDNDMGDNCTDNMFSCDNIYGNKMGNNFSRNIAEGIVMDCEFGNNCCNNTIAGSMINSRMRNNCDSNYFGNAYNVEYGDGCSYNVFVKELSDSFDYYNIEVEDLADCENIRLSGDNVNNIFVADANNVIVRNIDVSRYVKGDWGEYNIVELPYVGGDYELKVARCSLGEIKVYCEADLIVGSGEAADDLNGV